ncbi:mitochondrial 2-oxoglutarate/malate carrier protein-like, partial [Chiloscyllium plagiosum]|uniref:mitochondrial 2-oxoglutarate/malate carrier protein-like n=1 Tax=Chiloscyllium plagiosum TaxID=36176 RepID=UPI001CB7E45B
GGFLSTIFVAFVSRPVLQPGFCDGQWPQRESRPFSCRLPVDQQRGYTNVFNALIRITREEGVVTLWRGCIPTMTRAVVVNAAQLASYSQSKQFLLGLGYFRDNILCHFCASMISGLVTTAASMPVDIAKT